MKNNLEFYRHEVGAHEHPKFKMLRVHFGWEGEGRFWALTSLIARAEGCRLDISKPYLRSAVAADLGMSLPEFERYINFLTDKDQCSLLQIEEEKLTANDLQERLKSVNVVREKARVRKNGGSRGNDESSYEHGESSHELSESSGAPDYKGKVKVKESISANPEVSTDPKDSFIPKVSATSKKAKTKNNPTADAVRIARSFFDAIRKNLPNFEAATKTESQIARFVEGKNWAGAIDDAVSLDGREYAQLEFMTAFIHGGEYGGIEMQPHEGTNGFSWSKNFMSPAKFRKKDKEGVKYFDKVAADIREFMAKRKNKARVNHDGSGTF